MTALAELSISILIVLGGLFALLAGVGLLKLPDVLIRMHASTKIGTLACGLIMGACALHFADSRTVIHAVAIILFLLLTAPIGAHMIGRAAIFKKVQLRNGIETSQTAQDIRKELENE